VFSPFIVGSLMATYKLPGVIGLMIALLAVQIVVIWAWGVEPAWRSLEDLEKDAGPTDGSARAAQA
jgi:putative MFS transporter